MSESLFEAAGVNVTITGVYGILSVIILLLFMSLWLAGRKKRTGREVFAGQVMNGIGFGLLPALAVLKAFQAAAMNGAGVTKPLPCIRWLSVGGCYMPGRIETAAAAFFFILLCLWLIVRKDASFRQDLNPPHYGQQARTHPLYSKRQRSSRQATLPC